MFHTIHTWACSPVCVPRDLDRSHLHWSAYNSSRRRWCWVLVELQRDVRAFELLYMERVLIACERHELDAQLLRLLEDIVLGVALQELFRDRKVLRSSSRWYNGPT